MRIVFSILALLSTTIVAAQQIAHANNVQLVTTTGTNLVMQGGIKFTGSTTFKNDGAVTLLTNPAANISNWVDSTSIGVLTPTSIGTTVFNNYNTNQQLIGSTTFYNLKIAGAGLTLFQSNEVKNTLALDTGLIYFNTANDSIYVSNPILAAITSTSNYGKSWVHGKLSRLTNVAGTDYLFPIGKIKITDSLYAPIKLDKFNTTNAIYSAEYFATTPFDHFNYLTPPIDHISELEYWHVYSNIPSGTDDDAKLSLSWRGYSRVSATTLRRDSLLNAQYIFNPAGRWEATGGGYPAAVTGADSLFGFVKHLNSSINYTYEERRFTLATYSRFNALPLKLIYWTATPDVNKVRLNWNVQHEQDILHYEIEKSLDGIAFSHLSSVASQQKNSWLYFDYDNNPMIGWNYYRLKITDKQNKVSYAGVRKVKFEKGLQSINIFPNPATEFVNIILPSANAYLTTIQLYSIEGKWIADVKPTSTNTTINVTKLAKGSYVLRIIENGSIRQAYQFVKQ